MTDAKVPIGWSEEGHHKLLAATTVEELADALTSEMKRHTAGVTLVCGEGPDTQFIVDSSATTDGSIFNGTLRNRSKDFPKNPRRQFTWHLSCLIPD